ncbi:MAG: hypothetical protein JXQ29_02940 [Planctomycetes bacterium]|nr:hypothetical protein [Planctomycetota bacterium]
MRLVLLGLLGVALVAPGVAAQNEGDALVAVFNAPTTDFLVVTRNGVVTTLITRPGTSLPDGLAVAPGNDGGLFVETDGTTGALSVLKFQGATSITTLATLPATFTRVPTLWADQGGDILLLNMTGTDRGVYRMPAQGGPLTTIAHPLLGATFNLPFAMAEDLVSGDLVVLDNIQCFYRIDRARHITTVRYLLPPSMSPTLAGNLDVDSVTGLMYVTYNDFVVTLDPQTGANTTIFQSTPIHRNYHGIDNDPLGGGFYLSVQQITGLGGQYALRYDTRTGILTTVATLPTVNTTQLSDLLTWKSRMLSGRSRPAWGQPYALQLAIPSEAGRVYLAAASLGTLRGIPLPGNRRIPLDADLLFFLSLKLPGLFSGFQGVLDPGGRASLKVNTPAHPGLAGFRFYLAAVTYDPGGIRVITEPLGVTIE